MLRFNLKVVMQKILFWYLLKILLTIYIYVLYILFFNHISIYLHVSVRVVRIYMYAQYTLYTSSADRIVKWSLIIRTMYSIDLMNGSN